MHSPGSFDSSSDETVTFNAGYIPFAYKFIVCEYFLYQTLSPTWAGHSMEHFLTVMIKGDRIFVCVAILQVYSTTSSSKDFYKYIHIIPNYNTVVGGSLHMGIFT